MRQPSRRDTSLDAADYATTQLPPLRHAFFVFAMPLLSLFIFFAIFSYCRY
jgi:hypothetical protein